MNSCTNGTRHCDVIRICSHSHASMNCSARHILRLDERSVGGMDSWSSISQENILRPSEIICKQKLPEKLLFHNSASSLSHTSISRKRKISSVAKAKCSQRRRHTPQPQSYFEDNTELSQLSFTNPQGLSQPIAGHWQAPSSSLLGLVYTWGSGPRESHMPQISVSSIIDHRNCVFSTWGCISSEQR